ncbi:MAG: 2-dehydropantoate 2-reductase [Massilibacteroides sp.]|nr:2-dehydropantoate 2-reductase [Massilibacteroides sp.]MDD3061505.1 2-dehydropantoate 2-reductase [Massilibacteroides sp.]MDD4115792.1 2-dehydropantoate 2-reductase [Massilibacteroides sp.]MDD4659205.1 2-dehydropantoate 2-reductase [Massilibacteroides sp.]
MATIKIAISGIGAVGGYYGGMLAHKYKDDPDVEIYFISRSENMRVIKEKGLQIVDTTGSFTAYPRLVTDQPEEIGEVDFILPCTKSYDLEENLLSLTPLMGRNTIIIPFLNGANITEQIQKILPSQTVWQGCVYIGSRLREPGVVAKYSVKERLFFGSEKGNTEMQKKVLDLFIASGINAFNPEKITERIWKKFFMISTAATMTSYYDKPIDEVIKEKYGVFQSLCAELEKVAIAKGVMLGNDIVESTLETQKMMPPGSITSMHHDFRQGKKTELENLTGYVVREAKKLNISVPLYNTMYKKLSLQ